MTEHDLLAQIEAESTSLELHTQLCHLRYEQLSRKFEVVEKRFDKLESLMAEIKDSVIIQRSSNQELYFKWSNYIVVLLLGITGFLLSKYVLLGV